MVKITKKNNKKINKDIDKKNKMSNFVENIIIMSDCESENDDNCVDNNSENIINNNDDNNSENNNNDDYYFDSDDENNNIKLDNKKIFLEDYNPEEEKEKIKNQIKNSKNKIKKKNITREYLDYHNEYVQKYKKSIVLIQVGGFYESYSILTEGPDIYEIGQILNIIATKKDKSNKNTNESNPIMIGFPIHAVTKFLKILLDNSYNVIVIDQIKENIIINGKTKQNITRKVSGVYSPSTYVENFETSNRYLVTFYIEVNSSLSGIKNSYSIGMTSVDLTIGDIFHYELHDDTCIDENIAIQEANIFYHHYRPVEMIIYFINNTKNKINIDKILERIDILPNQCIYKYDTIDKSFSNVNYQNKLLSKVYKTGMVEPIIYFNLEKYTYTVMSLVLTFDFIFNHDKKLLNNIKMPLSYSKNKYLLLGNGAQYQLGIVDYYSYENKNFSLYSVINNCKTPMGKRYLKDRLTSPLTDVDDISNYYKYTNSLIKNNLFSDVREYLLGMSDIKKLFRKISIDNIQPYQLYSAYESLCLSKNLYDFLFNSKFKKYLDNFVDIENYNDLKKSISYIEKTFNLYVIKSLNLKEIKESFYNKSIHKDIDLLIGQINGGHEYFQNLCKELLKITSGINLKIKHNDRDGYYLHTTKIKGELLKKTLIEDKNIKIKIDDSVFIGSSELEFSFTLNGCKITCSSIGNKNKEMHLLYFDLDKLVKNKYINDVSQWYIKHNKTFDKIIYFITEIDYISNNAHNANKFHYCKPEIIISEHKNKTIESFVRATQMRHPVIERNINHEYIPHDACLDSKTRGNLIYGVNSCGKSSLMKSIGINIIMAQCGLYVPAQSFEFHPFTSLYTRITGNDDLSKGLSSFVVELNELRNILKKSDKNTLIIGDEICRGTEYLSANSLVAASIIKINKTKAKYIFATHLHELSKLDKIKELNKLKMFHLSIDYKDDELIFNRKLIEGNGEEVYGITIAKYILNDPQFITTAIQFKNEFLKDKNKNTLLLSNKQSNYNKKIFIDTCSLCESSKNLESHHINFQRDFKKSQHLDKNKKHILKNSQSNIIILCSNCHDDLHKQKFSISTVVQTTNGIKPI